MTRRILFRPEAEAELREAVAWYESRAQGLGTDFLRSLEAAVAVIHRHPTIHPEVFGTARRVLLRRFPYSLVYVVSDEEILVVACIHGRRDPRRWQGRL